MHQSRRETSSPPSLFSAFDCFSSVTTDYNTNARSIHFAQHKVHPDPSTVSDIIIVDNTDTLIITQYQPHRQYNTTSKKEKMIVFFRALQSFCYTLARSLYKYVLHVGTGQGELERICSQDDGRHTATMTYQFTSCVNKSKQLHVLQKLVLIPRSFSVQAMLVDIVTIKKIGGSKTVVLANLTNCLQALRLVNVVFCELHSQRQLAFNYQDPSHVALLEQLWQNLKPNQPRSHNRNSAEWGQLGFQGHDPSTDFRGMGLLGLQQLEYFSRRHPFEAQALLLDSLKESHYFPFAATGINMTAFVLELFQNQHLHGYIYDRLDSVILQDVTNSEEGPSADRNCVLTAVDLIHEMYCTIYLEFGKTWNSSAPKDVMAFPEIFHRVKELFKVKYPSIDHN
jgi:ELMO domain-containing protein